MSVLRNLRQALARCLGRRATTVLACDSRSISFDPVLHVSSSKTLHALNLAADHLHKARVVAFPTETVYGLGALARDPLAAGNIFSTKGRPADNPLIVHVSSSAMLHSFLPKGYTMSPAYHALTKHFWPGALTLLFPRDPHLIPDIITAGQSSVAVRMPSHPVARALIEITNSPLAAPSANTSGKPSPTKAEHVHRDLDGKLPLILDGGACTVGVESTVVDGLQQDGHIRVLRPGGITLEDIERVLKLELPEGEVPKVLVHRRDYRDEAMEQAPTTPGMKYRHYSPSVPVTLLHTSTQPPAGQNSISATSFLSNLPVAASAKAKVGVLAPTDSKLWQVIQSERDIEWHKYTLGPVSEPAVTAQRLFDGLLTLEQELVDFILVEEISEEREGLAVMNRVRKAAGESRWIHYDSC